MARSKIMGFDRLFGNLKRFEKTIDKEIKDHVKRTAQLIRTEAILSIHQSAKTGIVYEKYSPNRIHIASAKGEAPATDTGYLANQIKADFTGFSAQVISNADYSYFLEFDMDRPFLFPAMEKNRSYFVNKLRTIKRKKWVL